MVTNSVSFYLAIASIMFAVVPSLPMPEEGIYEEWQRTRKTMGIAISLLLMSVLGVLISFTAASNAVVSEEYSWRHGGLTFYPAIVAGLVCLIGIMWFFIRLLRLIFSKNVMIRKLYQSLFRIKE
jgi:MFS family permease